MSTQIICFCGEIKIKVNAFFGLKSALTRAIMNQTRSYLTCSIGLEEE